MSRHQDLIDEIGTSLARRHSTATVLFHHAVAERLGLGPTDHKCLDLLHDRGAMTGSELAALTGLTTGAVTGVVARLERAGLVEREPHASDRRKQVLRVSRRAVEDVQAVFDGLAPDPASVLDGFTTEQLETVRLFLTRATDLAHRRAVALRAAAQLPVR